MVRVLRCLLFALSLLLAAAPAQDPPRDPAWCAPLQLDGVGNLFKVDEGLYRSAQPSDEGMKRLKALGVRTVIDLRAFHGDHAATSAAGLLDEELSVKTWHIEDEDVVRVMKLLADPTGAPYLIHCQHGADRTGLMVAMYRILRQHWTKDAAIAEMTQGGFGFHPVWSNIVEYVRKADVEALGAALAR
jgi:protein tyrosine/serine phosphatase